MEEKVLESVNNNPYLGVELSSTLSPIPSPVVLQI
jgi:hypothetical protein